VITIFFANSCYTKNTTLCFLTPHQHNHQTHTLSEPRRISLLTLAAVTLLSTAVAGTGGYLLGRETTLQQREHGLVNNPMPTTLVTGSMTNTRASSPTPLPPEKAWSTHTSFVSLPSNLKISYNAYGGGMITDDPQSFQGRKNDEDLFKYTWISFAYDSSPMPKTFVYRTSSGWPAKGEADNPTVKPYTINGYTGIRGKQTDSFYGSDDEVVYLQSPYGGYASFVPQHGDVRIFNFVHSRLLVLLVA
jgi:hypothetical protein